MQQKIYPVNEDIFPISKVDPDALFVMEKLRGAGHVAYLVGGSVRDILLKQAPKDFDISTSAEPEEIKALFRNCILIGRRFRLAHIRFGKKILEVSTFRSGDIETDALIVRDNDWGSPEEDALRRDFTINGLFYDPATHTIIDYVGGFPDIQKKYLRTIGQSFLRFKQDPVRMIRLIKFQARFGFEIDNEARIALLECRGEILKSSSARILEEFLRMLESGASRHFFKLMNEHGLLELMMPSISRCLQTQKGEEIFSYLEEIDADYHDPDYPILPRPVLLSCLLFPLFQTQIDNRFISRQRNPHLGEIQNEAHLLLDEVFQPFFLIPRRIRGSIISVLTAQYRITPVEKKHARKPRIPSDPDFHLGMKFFDVRRCIEPGLEKVWEEWCEIYQEPPPRQEAPVKRRRKRRRRSR